MAISSRGEMGVGGGSRGGFGGGGRSKAVKPTIKKKLAEPKSAVKVVKGTNGQNNMDRNATEDVIVQLRKNGELAKITALRYTGKPNTTVKINTNPTKPKGIFGPLKARASRTRSGQKAAPAKRATGRK